MLAPGSAIDPDDPSCIHAPLKVASSLQGRRDFLGGPDEGLDFLRPVRKHTLANSLNPAHKRHSRRRRLSLSYRKDTGQVRAVALLDLPTSLQR